MINKYLFTVIILFFYYSSGAQTSDFVYSPSAGTLCTPQSITFTQTSSGSPSSFIWNFGNGQTGNQAAHTVVYDDPGTYTVKLITIYNNVAISTSKTIIINATPEITLTATKFSLCTPGSVVFTANSSNSITSWLWTFDDGSPAQTTSVNTLTHFFSAYDTVRVIVRGSTPEGCSMTAALNIPIAKFPLSASVTPTKGCIPTIADFQVNADILPGDTRQSVLWDFGDGFTASNNFLMYSHTYNTTQDITTAKIIVTTAQGCSNEYVFPLFAYGTPPTGTQAYTTSARDTFCGSETIDFFASATNANLYTWNFDGNILTSATNTISYKFNTLGPKNVVVTPSFNGCAGTKDSLQIFIKGVIAYFNIQNTCNKKNNYFFQNNSLGNISHFEWTFSDTPGTVDSVNLSASHNFPTAGTFNTNLLLIDNTTGCTDNLNKNIYTALPVFTSDKISVCKDSLIIYTVNQSYPAGAGYTYDYHINGTLITVSSAFLNYYPLNHGISADYMVINDSLPGTCSDSLFLSPAITVKGPVATFTVAGNICADTAATIINSSYPFYPNEPISNWKWTFGDNKKDSVMNPAPHFYPKIGDTYTVTLTATDINGCGSMLSKTVTINPLPIVNILPRHDTLCSGQTKQLIAYSTSNITWTPATQTSCTSCDTVMVTPTSSVNYFALAKTSFGCKRQDTAFIIVRPKPGTLTVTPSDTSICPGGSVSYMLNNTGIASWTPGTFLSNSSILNPVSVPKTNITYRVIVADAFGCFTDTAYAKIKIYTGASVKAGPDLQLDYDAPFRFNPIYTGNIQSYLWSPAQGLQCTSCPSPAGIAKKATDYIIKIKDIDGCISADTVSVKINCMNRFFIPSAFTPNGDGLNDYFYPMVHGGEKIKSFVIYNRYGIKAFERKNFEPNIASLGWNGMLKGSPILNTQSFVWMAEVECNGQIIMHKGNVLLLR